MYLQAQGSMAGQAFPALLLFICLYLSSAEVFFGERFLVNCVIACQQFQCKSACQQLPATAIVPSA
jgi:hypothetical protein